jgi:hypothetical protein
MTREEIYATALKYESAEAWYESDEAGIAFGDEPALAAEKGGGREERLRWYILPPRCLKKKCYRKPPSPEGVGAIRNNAAPIKTPYGGAPLFPASGSVIIVPSETQGGPV